MSLFKKKRIWTNSIYCSYNDEIYTQDVLDEFYRRVSNSKGKIISIQVMPSILSKLNDPDDEMDYPYTSIYSYPIIFITYSSKEKISFDEETFMKVYENSLEKKVLNFNIDLFDKSKKN